LPKGHVHGIRYQRTSPVSSHFLFSSAILRVDRFRKAFPSPYPSRWSAMAFASLPCPHRVPTPPPPRTQVASCHVQMHPSGAPSQQLIPFTFPPPASFSYANACRITPLECPMPFSPFPASPSRLTPDRLPLSGHGLSALGPCLPPVRCPWKPLRGLCQPLFLYQCNVNLLRPPARNRTPHTAVSNHFPNSLALGWTTFSSTVALSGPNPDLSLSLAGRSILRDPPLANGGTTPPGGVVPQGG
jgi:hypothetical protein